MNDLSQWFIRPRNSRDKRKWQVGEKPKDEKELLAWLYDHGFVKTSDGLGDVRKNTKRRLK